MRLLHMKHTGSTRLSALNGRLVSDAFQCDAMRKVFFRSILPSRSVSLCPYQFLCYNWQYTLSVLALCLMGLYWTCAFTSSHGYMKKCCGVGVVFCYSFSCWVIIISLVCPPNSTQKVELRICCWHLIKTWKSKNSSFFC